MEIKKTQQEGCACLSPEGRLDTNAAPAFQAALLEELGANDELLLDLQNLEYVSSSGLRAFLLGVKTAAAQGKTLLFTNVGEEVKEVLCMTGIWDFIKIKE